MVFGIGINDSNDPIKVNGKLTKPYSIWKSILQRCYSNKCHSIHPTYQNCTVCEEWLQYSNFLKWYENNYVEGYHIDKDILIEGNTIYSLDYCVFIPKELNNLLTDRKSLRGQYKIGVSYIQRDRKFQASISINGKPTNLGYFDSELDAHEAWRIAKISRVRELALGYYSMGCISAKIKDALLSRDFR